MFIYYNLTFEMEGIVCIYNYDKFDKSITEFVKENNIQSSTDYLLITSLKDKFTYVYEYKNG